MHKNYLLAFLVFAGLLLQNAYAEDSGSPLADTQNCLRNQNCESAQTEAGIAADQHALAAVGGNAANKQEVYDISADIMPYLVQQSGGDPNKMLIIIQKAQADPEGFMNSLPANVQTRIRSAALAMDKHQ
jgi:hypothetical protein